MKTKNKIIIVIVLVIICILGYFAFKNKENTENAEQYTPQMTDRGMYNIHNIYELGHKTAYLTFDDGPTPKITKKILDILKKENIKATFFVLGSKAEQYPNIVKRAYKEGHYIANHGYSHDYSRIYQSPESVLAEYMETEKVLAEVLENENYESHLFRFPGGSWARYRELKAEAKELLKENNIAYLDWNSLTQDAEGEYTAEELLNNLKKFSLNKDNLVILCHDSEGKETTCEVLKDMISYLREQGYRFGNMRNMIR